MSITTDPHAICIIGNLNIDLIIRNVPKMPAWGQEVMGASRDQFSSGQAGYLAFALRRLGVPTSVIGNVGEDIYGQQILSDLSARGVNIQGVSVMPGGKTGITVAIVRADGERAFVTDLGCLPDFSEAMVEPHWDLVEDAAIVCMVGLFCTPGLSFEAAARLLGRARQAGKITMLDTGWDPGNWGPETQAGMRGLLAQVALFMPNQDEAQAITGQETVDGMAQALQDLGVDTVVIKSGEQGSYVRRGAATCHVSTPLRAGARRRGRGRCFQCRLFVWSAKRVAVGGLPGLWQYDRIPIYFPRQRPLSWVSGSSADGQGVSYPVGVGRYRPFCGGTT